MLRGSYYNGFAPRDGMPLYPSLWRGCIGAWAPCLGPTGATLRDWSGLGRHGAITNATPSTLWSTIDGRYGALFDGSDDQVIVGSISASLWTFTAWVRRDRTTAGYQRIFGQTSFNIDIAATFTTNTLACFDGTWRTLSSVAMPATTTFVAVTYNGSQLQGTIGLTQYSAVTAGRALAGSSTIGTYQGAGVDASNSWQGMIDDVRIYNRVLSPNELAILASRRGIAYDLAPFRMPYSEQVAGFQAAWALRQRLILGGGGGLG